jgi:hypothetical protein
MPLKTVSTKWKVTIQNPFVFCIRSLTATVSDIECYSIDTEHQKAAEPLSCNRQTKLPLTAMTSEFTDIMLSKHKEAWLCSTVSFG